MKQEAKICGQKQLNEEWSRKSLYGQYVLRSSNTNVD